MSKGKILFELTGSIACYKACYVVSRLVQAGYEVEVVASKSALEFVGKASLEGLTGKAVHTDTFEPGRYMQHIHLAKWADLVIVCPASANTINKLATGIGDDLISTLFLAHDFAKPFLLTPAMNTKMYRHPATQASLEKLKGWGARILETASGVLACGDIGEGRLLEPELIFHEIEKALGSTQRSHPSKPLEILITSGGTREPIDGVRSIANFSSGRTGASLADHFAWQGHSVTFLHAKDSAEPQARVTAKSFVTFNDLSQALKTELGHKRYDAVLHLAAVSDYAVEGIEANGVRLDTKATGKIDSGEDVTIKLKKNPKIVDALRSMSSNPELRVVAFKLTNTPDPDLRLEAVRKLALHAQPDWIVQNDLSEIDPSGDRHVSTIYSGQGDPAVVSHAETKFELAQKLESLLMNERKTEL